MTETQKLAATVIITILALLVIGLLFVFSGIYNVAADVPHTRLVYWLMNTARERSIDVRDGKVEVPATLTDQDRVEAGAGMYAEMCEGCHLAPGTERTELSRGLYPTPPDLSQIGVQPPGEEFWIIKHGIKMTAMPAWGKTHSDDQIWNIVAFLQKLPSLSPTEYDGLVESAPESHDEMMEYGHEDHDH